MTLRARLGVGRLLTGPFLGLPSPAVVEIACMSGPDFVCIDMEHGALSPETAENMLRAAALHAVPALVRVGAVDPVAIGLALDMGATGILVPRVNTAEEARRVVAAARFPPEGLRGAGPGRVSGYGRSIPQALARARSETVVALQIETLAALEALDEIVAVPGVDLLFVGPGDLAVALEAAGRIDALGATVDGVLSTCRTAGRAAGIFALTRDALEPYEGRVALGIVGSDMTVLAAGFDAAFGGQSQA